MNVKPLPRSVWSTSRIVSGLTVSAALSRKYVVSITWSPSSWAISSRPVASGTFDLQVGVDELFRAAAAVARAPALVGLGEDHRAQLEDAVGERLRARRAARDVHVDRHELVRRHDRVVVEHALRGAARAHRDRPARLEHLVIDAPHDRRHLDRD